MYSRYNKLSMFLCLVIACLLASCSSNAPTPAERLPQPPGGLTGFRPEIPFPPLAEEANRQVSVEIEDEKLGKSTALRSDGVINSGDFLVIDAEPAEYAYGMYRFDGLTDEDAPWSLSIKRNSLTAEYYLGVADYNTMRWHWSDLGSAGAPTASDISSFSPLLDPISPGGNIYAVILMWNDAEITVESIKLTVDLDVDAPIADFTATPRHGNAPLEIEFDASSSFVRGGGGFSAYAWDFDNNGTIDETNVIPFASHVFSSSGEHHPRLVVTSSTNGFTDEHVVKVYVHGWISTWGDSDMDGINGVVLSGNRLFTAGWISNSAGNLDILVTSYDQWGKPRWQRALGDTESEYAYGIVEHDGEYLVTVGRSSNISGYDYVLTACYDHYGNVLWQRGWDSGGRETEPRITIDAAGNTYVATRFKLEAWTHHETALLKYSPTGALLWQKRVVAPGSQSQPEIHEFFGSLTLANGFEIDADNYLAVCKLDLDGVVTDSTRLLVGNAVVPFDIKADLSGNVYVTGRYYSAGGNRPFLLKTNNALVTQWFKSWSHPEGTSIGHCLSFNKYQTEPDEIYVGVSIYPAETDNLGSLLNLTAAGNLAAAWLLTHAEADVEIRALCHGLQGAVILGGIAQDTTVPMLAISPTVVNLLNTDFPHGASTSDYVGDGFTPTAGQSIPDGVLNTGGGGNDMLLISIEPGDI